MRTKQTSISAEEENEDEAAKDKRQPEAHLPVHQDEGEEHVQDQQEAAKGVRFDEDELKQLAEDKTKKIRRKLEMHILSDTKQWMPVLSDLLCSNQTDDYRAWR